jgi:hypothetical protein
MNIGIGPHCYMFFFSPNVIPLTIGPKFLDNVGVLIFLKYN